ncbi:hypothetical protein [Chroococcidiopsis sp. SAG 2025]|nr:hypothetical protein [Chroococcidiopsis sp. SAG 2025]
MKYFGFRLIPALELAMSAVGSSFPTCRTASACHYFRVGLTGTQRIFYL